MKNKPQINNHHLLLGAGLVLVLILVFVFGKHFKKDNTEQKNIDVKVNIKDQNGQTIAYDPNPLLIRLNKGLTTRYYFDFSERCNPIKELYNLDAARFMAAVKAYKSKYNEDITTHMKACYANCKTTGTYNGENYFDLIYQRIAALRDVIV
ncbi:hypothetical protein [Aureispira anguillae]|uniref:Uncharacterized protein n=1 Tax=Aureispira anguillae TaxID=2864201 RepID=A0A915YFW2_9BACT|nr:hypothetical protein [Aureispira anguillae]BDS12389.1 hypothetical protein AsAng_0031100 [Aureispira anguillae]